MAAIEQIVPNLLGGVSQQPDPVMLPGQVRQATNVLLDPTFGCMKRPATEWVSDLSTAIPDTAQWFPIFRDNSEKYVVALYRDGTNQLVCRVWDAIDGEEVTVNISQDFQAYAGETPARKFRTLTIADFTLLCNTEAEVGLSRTDIDERRTQEALVTVDTVSYNTSYNIDFSKPDDTTPQVTTIATKLQISPATWIDSDERCKFDQAESFIVDHVDGQDPAIDEIEDSGNDDDLVPEVGPGVGLSFRIVTQGTVQRDEDDEEEFDCRYKTDVILQNGGQGWRKGDWIEVEMEGKDYKVKVVETREIQVFNSIGTVTHTTPANAEGGALTVSEVVNSLASEINSNIAGFEATTVSNVIRIRRTTNPYKRFNISTRGGTTGNAMTALRGTARDVSDLPSQCFDEYFLKIVNTDDAEADDYYVQFESNDPGVPGPGSWVETVNLGDEETLNELSMPFALIRQADGTFTLGPLDGTFTDQTYAGRTVGDKNTCPTPSFVGNRILGMFLHRNRLGFLTEDAAVLSQPGDFFNFYNISGVALSPADPVDISASDTKPVILRDAISTPQGVVLLGDQAQFRLFTAESTFGPNTVELKKISSYDYKSDALPQLTGVSVVFNTNVGEFNKVFEMSVQSLAQSPVTQEITRNIPRYIPLGINWSACSTNNDIVMYGGTDSDVYVFRYYNAGDERQVAGWAKWQFRGNIDFAAFSGDTCFLVQRVGSTTQLLKMPLLDGPESPIDVGFTQFRPRIDAQLAKSDLVQGSTINLPSGRVVTEYTLPAEYRVENFTGIAAFTDVRTGEYDVIDVTSDTIQVDAGREFIFGVEYESLLELPTFYTKRDKRADRISNPMIQRVYLDLFNSGAMQVDIDVQGYATRNVILPIIEADSYAASSVVIAENYTADIDVYQLGKYVQMTIKSSTPFPTSMTSYTWTGHYNKRGYSTI